MQFVRVLDIHKNILFLEPQPDETVASLNPALGFTYIFLVLDPSSIRANAAPRSSGLADFPLSISQTASSPPTESQFSTDQFLKLKT